MNYGGTLTSVHQLLAPFGGKELIEWFTDLTDLWRDTSPIKPKDISSPKGLTQWVHYKNFVVWHLEEYIRKPDVSAEESVKVNKTIDLHNTRRLEAIEQIDIWMENVLQSAGIAPDKDLEANSETPGSIIDRLSILTLKINHMMEQLAKAGTKKDKRSDLELRIHVIEDQRSDLAAALDRLLLDLCQAKKRHVVYRQFKIYNDPSFHVDDFSHH